MLPAASGYHPQLVPIPTRREGSKQPFDLIGKQAKADRKELTCTLKTIAAGDTLPV